MDGKLDKVREFARSEKAYRPPKEVDSKNSSDIQDLDEIKLHELKEVRIIESYLVITPLNISINSGLVLQFVRPK